MKHISRDTRDIISLIRPSVRKLAAYHIDETPCRVKLDAMENPFALPGAAQRAVGDALRGVRINRYPDPSGKELKRTLARSWGVDPAAMLLGNGSDELIQAIILAFGGPVLAPAPSFAMYEITARALAQNFTAVPLRGDFSLDADGIIRAAAKQKARVLFLACPNNPTGNRFAESAIRKILRSVNAAVVIDEAYYSFSGKTLLPLLRAFPNMIVLRTLSKIGFAGLRIGMLAAAPGLVAELEKIRLPYNINTLSQVAAVAALRSGAAIDRQISVLISERERLYNALSRMGGVTVYPSETNFLLLRTAGDASRIHAALKERGILVKNLNRPGPLKHCLRVTVGTPRENAEFLKNLKAVMAAV